MKKTKIYIDTSVIGGCFDPEFNKYSNILINEIISREKYGFISDITKVEIIHAPKVIINFFNSIEPYLEEINTNNEAEKLADLYLKEKIVSYKYRNDCLHIALATVYNLDVLVSWNFKHIVNYDKILKFNSVNLKNGYKILQIFSPREVVTKHD